MPIITKTVKGQKYLYFLYYDRKTKKKVELYCGPEKNPASRTKATVFSKQFLERRVKDLQDEITKLDKVERKK